MTPGQTPLGPTPDDERDEAIERALCAVPRPAARAEFRDGLRTRFLAAARGASTVPLVDMVDEPRGPRAGQRTNRVWAWAGALAAAAVVVFLVYLKPTESRWKVVGSSKGIVNVDGVRIPVEDHARLEKSLVDAREIETDDRVQLQFGDWYVLDLAPGSRIAMTPIEQRTRPEPLLFQVEKGTLSVQTGPAFVNAELRVITQDLTARATGTNFAVDLLDSGTCVCCLNGTVKVILSASKPQETVSGNGTYRNYRDDRAPKTGGINPAHVAPLNDLDQLSRTLWPTK